MAKKRKSRRLGGRALALACSRAADEKKARGTVVLDMRGISSITDYFVICSGGSDRQVKAIAEAAVEQARRGGVRCHRSEGWSDARWIVLDFGDVIAHIFLDETRDYYQLERLWGDAKKVR